MVKSVQAKLREQHVLTDEASAINVMLLGVDEIAQINS
jgi:hypothetical protein